MPIYLQIDSIFTQKQSKHHTKLHKLIIIISYISPENVFFITFASLLFRLFIQRGSKDNRKQSSLKWFAYEYETRSFIYHHPPSNHFFH